MYCDRRLKAVTVLSIPVVCFGPATSASSPGLCSKRLHSSYTKGLSRDSILHLQNQPLQPLQILTSLIFLLPTVLSFVLQNFQLAISSNNPPLPNIDIMSIKNILTCAVLAIGASALPQSASETGITASVTGGASASSDVSPSQVSKALLFHFPTPAC